jgi:hypothetical protein
VTLTEVDTEDERLGPLLTDEEGRFVFRQVPPGTYLLQAAMLGFQPRRDTLALDRGTEVQVALGLSVSPLPLEPLLVVVMSRPPSDMDNFRARRARLHGTYFDREDIEERFAVKVSDLLRAVPSVSVIEGRPNNLRGGGGGFSAGCPMPVYVDGIWTDQSIEDAISPDMIEAMEVYPSLGQVPVQYRRGPCGVVLIWTRRDVATERRPGALWKAFTAVAAVATLLWVLSR